MVMGKKKSINKYRVAILNEPKYSRESYINHIITVMIYNYEWR